MNSKLYHTFFSYVIPSVFAFALSGIYTIIDGFFVGNSVGDIGLSTINIAYPVVSLLQAVGTGVGMGGAVMYTLKLSIGENAEAKKYLYCTAAVLCVMSLVLTIILHIALRPILHMLGAVGEIEDLGVKYLKYIIIGAIFQIFATGIVPIIRNNNGANFAMAIMIAGFVCNILLDYLFVWIFGWSVAGAAIATVIGQAFTAVGGFAYLVYHKIPFLGIEIKNSEKEIKNILKIGIAPFGISIMPLISHLFMNRFSMQYGGKTAVAGYACIGYVFAVVCLLIQGVGDGSQPLISRYYSMNDEISVSEVQTLAYRTAAILSVVCMVVLYAIRGYIGLIFGASNLVIKTVSTILPIFLSGYIFLSFSRITTAAFYATERILYSYFLVYAEPIFQIVLLALLPYLWRQTGVWWCMPLSQIITAMAAFILKIITKKH